jgi:bifunctional non-homologous end joining protein LigD
MSDKKIKVGRHVIEVSSPERILYPQDGITKADVVSYYQRIAKTMLPHMKDRPLSMQRFPNGISESGFYQKEVPDYFPDWIDRVEVEVKGEGSTQHQVVCNKAETLVYLAEQGCLTPHIWLSQVDDLERPDKLIFDLDPPGNDFELVRSAARSLRSILEEVELYFHLMTTGSRGLHVVIPLDRSASFDEVRDFARDLSVVLSDREPDKLTTETRKDKRKGRLFLDYLRNSYAQTSVPPYALRAKAGAPVATPLNWEELDRPKLTSSQYTLRNIFQRLDREEDPWKDIYRQGKSLEKAREMLDNISTKK